jgi:hypothetical protein
LVQLLQQAVQLLQQAARDAVGKTLVRQTLEADDAGTHFTCFTGTKVRILTQLRQPLWANGRCCRRHALQKYKY